MSIKVPNFKRTIMITHSGFSQRLVISKQFVENPPFGDSTFETNQSVHYNPKIM